MLNSFFGSIFDTELTREIEIENCLLCIGVALLLGAIMALAYMFKTKFTKSFVVTVALLPAIVGVVIMMVNGSVGAGVAVAGAFSLVRFRSAPGTAREIVTLFMAMGTGLIVGMGYLGFAVVFTVIMCAVFVLYNFVGIHIRATDTKYKTLKITIPEDLDYSDAFDDIFMEYTRDAELVRVKTTNMGSMFRLTYNVTLRDLGKEKEMIDKIRCRNGNLEIMVSKQETDVSDL